MDVLAFPNIVKSQAVFKKRNAHSSSISVAQLSSKCHLQKAVACCRLEPPSGCGREVGWSSRLSAAGQNLSDAAGSWLARMGGVAYGVWSPPWRRKRREVHDLRSEEPSGAGQHCAALGWRSLGLEFHCPRPWPLIRCPLNHDLWPRHHM